MRASIEEYKAVEKAAMKIIEKLKNKEKNVLKANNENERN